MHLNWAYRGFNVHFAGTYTDGFADALANGESYDVHDRFLVDGQVTYAFRANQRRVLRDTKVTLGVRNLFDWDPPQAYGEGRNTTGYPSYLYTAENRLWHVSLSRRF